MKTKAFFVLLASILIASWVAGCAAFTRHEATSGRVIEPIVSSDWLSANKHLKDLVIIDIRGPDDYGAGHIPGSINEPFADKAGHIPNAKSLPASWIWNKNPDGTYTYKDSMTLRTMASSGFILVRGGAL
jgi:hypothetical protein